MSTDEPPPEVGGVDELAELGADAAGSDPHTLEVLAALRATKEELSRLADIPPGESAMPADVAAVLSISLEWEVLARAQRG
jgi:hypothetical protein